MIDTLTRLKVLTRKKMQFCRTLKCTKLIGCNLEMVLRERDNFIFSLAIFIIRSSIQHLNLILFQNSCLVNGDHARVKYVYAYSHCWWQYVKIQGKWSMPKQHGPYVVKDALLYVLRSVPYGTLTYEFCNLFSKSF